MAQDQQRETIDIHALLEVLKSSPQHQPRPNVIEKNVNVLLLAVIMAAGALVWSTVTKMPEGFSVIQQQTTEIRTTVIEIGKSVTDLSQKIDQNQKATADQQARLTGIETTVVSQREVMSQLNDRLTDLERNRDRGHR